ncbi:MAG: hypothetical protein U0871_09445 [Gemmataceae bacterium]
MLDPRPDSETSRRLLDRAAAGSPAAPGELLARHRPALVRFVDSHLDPAVRGRVDPSDVAQEALADLARGRPGHLAARPVPFHLWARKAAYDRVRNAARAGGGGPPPGRPGRRSCWPGRSTRTRPRGRRPRPGSGWPRRSPASGTGGRWSGWSGCSPRTAWGSRP